MTYYDAIAKGYNELYKEEQLNKFKIINDYVSKKDNINKMLDLGCGTFFSHEFFKYDVYGVEPSKKMIEQHPDFENLVRKKKLFVDDAENVCDLFSNNFFDAVICVTSAHHFNNLEKVLNCVKKISRKNAIIVFSLLKSESLHNVLSVIQKFFKIDKEISDGKDLIVFCTQDL